MADYSQFHAVFPLEGQKPYDTNGVREIETYRKSFHGVLFIDRVLRALGIGEGAPSSNPALSLPALLTVPRCRKSIPPQGREWTAQLAPAGL